MTRVPRPCRDSTRLLLTSGSSGGAFPAPGDGPARRPVFVAIEPRPPSPTMTASSSSLRRADGRVRTGGVLGSVRQGLLDHNVGHRDDPRRHAPAVASTAPRPALRLAASGSATSCVSAVGTRSLTAGWCGQRLGRSVLSFPPWPLPSGSIWPPSRGGDSASSYGPGVKEGCLRPAIPTRLVAEAWAPRRRGRERVRSAGGEPRPAVQRRGRRTYTYFRPTAAVSKPDCPVAR